MTATLQPDATLRPASSLSHELRLEAMGTAVHVVVVGSEADVLAARAVHLLAEIEQRWSRFLPTSEVSQINRAESEPRIVSEPTFELIDKAAAAWRLTNGRFDPFMGRAIARAGYDRSFDTIAGATRPLVSERSTGGEGLRLDPGSRLVQLAAGVEFDPGGIGKGLAADLVSARIMAEGAVGVLVNVGGDLRVRGVAPTGGAWIISIREPAVSDESLATVALTDGAIATSTTLRRRWPGPDGSRHHVLDPETSRPSRSGCELVSVIAGSAWWAEATATAALVDDDPSGMPALRVDTEGRVSRDNGFRRYEQ